MRRIPSSRLLAAVTVVVSVCVVAPSARAGEASVSPDLRRFMRSFAIEGRLRQADHVVTEVHSSDPTTGQPLDGADLLADARPHAWGAFHITGPAAAFSDLLQSPPAGSTATPQWDPSLARMSDAYVFYLRTEGTVRPTDAVGFNIGFDRDPAVAGKRLDGGPTPSDCVIDSFHGGGQDSLATQVFGPGASDFAPVDAPILRIAHSNGVIFVVPAGHPCVGAGAIGPATYGVAGNRAAEHAVVAPGRPFLPLRVPTIPIAATPRPAASNDSGGGGGATGRTAGLVGLGLIGVGVGVALAIRRNRHSVLDEIDSTPGGPLPGAYEGPPTRLDVEDWHPTTREFDWEIGEVTPEEAGHIGQILGSDAPPAAEPAAKPPAAPHPAAEPAAKPPAAPPDHGPVPDSEASVLDDLGEGGPVPGIS